MAAPTLTSVQAEIDRLKQLIPLGASPDIALVAGGLLEVPTALALSTLSKSELYARMKDGTLRYVSYGKRRMIPRLALLELLANHLSGEAGASPPHGLPRRNAGASLAAT